MSTRKHRPPTQAFTLIELLVVISIIALLIGILLPALAYARITANRMKSSTQVRGIQQAMVTYAQGNANFYPGVDGSSATILASGPLTGSSGAGDVPLARYWVLLNGSFFTPEYAISPLETNGKVVWTSGAVTTVHVSYAMLRINTPNRLAEWKDTINTSAVAMSDRNIGTGGAAATVRSIHTALGEWRGTVARNDNSTGFATTFQLKNTKFGTGGLVPTDGLFSDDPDNATVQGNDAAMVFGDASAYANQ